MQENQMKKYKQRTLYINIYIYTYTHILVYANTIQILDEINKFLRKYKWPKLFEQEQKPKSY